MNQWRRITTMLGLLSCLAMVSPACVIRARAQVRARPVYVVDEAPPPPRYRTVAPRAGYIWVRGQWEWRGNQWFWVDGHWERERVGYVFEPGHWEQRGNRWHWIEGRWVAGGSVVSDGGRHGHVEPVERVEGPRPPRHGHVDYPTAPPPAPRDANRPSPRAGYIWVEGRWQWSNGNWDWVAGHWERARTGYEWEAGRWERQADRYVWIDGRWVEVQAGPKVRDHRHGHVTPPGEPPRHGHVTGPTSPPPAPRDAQRPAPRAGYVWVEGRWQWSNGNWDWVAGHWERARTGYVWQPGRWELQGGVYVWLDGQWVVEQQSGPKVRDHRRGGQR